MSTGPRGAQKAAEENADAIENARKQNDDSEPKLGDMGNPAAPDEDKGKAPAETNSNTRGRRAATTTASPESVSKPGDEQQTPEAPLDGTLSPNPNTPSGAARQENDPVREGEARFDVAPNVGGPNDPIAQGVVQVVRKAREGEPSDPAGNYTFQEKAEAKSGTPKNDPFVGISPALMPVSASVGQVIGTIEEYSGRAIFSLSLVGWVGDAPFKIRADDISEVEQVLAQLRAALKDAND